jgi:outer membrane protein assembly factor BamB
MDRHSGELKWTTTVGGNHGFAQSERAVFVRDESDTVRAYEVGSGVLAWCRDLTPSGGEDQDWGVVVVDSVAAVFDGGDVVGLDASTGAELWRTAAPAGELFMTEGESMIWIHDDGAESLPPIALDPVDGSFDPDAEPSPSADSTLLPTMVEGLRLIPEYRNTRTRTELTVSVTDLADAQLWEARLPGSVAWIVPSVNDPVVVLKRGPRLSGYDALTGGYLWEIAVNDWSDTPRATDPESFFLSTGTQVRAVDAATGTQIWVADHGSPGQSTSYPLAGGYAFFAVDGHTLVGLIEAQAPHRD